MAIKILAPLAALIIMTGTAAATTDAEQKDEATAREIIAMHWQDGPAELPASHSKVSGSSGKIVTGAEAKRLRELVDPAPMEGIEAVAVDFSTKDEVLYQYFNTGYVSLDDWADIDPAAFMAQIKKNEVESNRVRREHGTDEIHTTGWVEPPTLHRDSQTITWIIQGTVGTGDERFMNAIVLKLGRSGFEKVTWIADPISPLDGFRVAMNSHEFEPGYRYTDHVANDRAAEYGVAGLVAGLLGVKLAKAAGIGGAAALAIFAKKLGFLIVLPFVGLWAFIKRQFRRQTT